MYQNVGARAGAASGPHAKSAAALSRTVPTFFARIVSASTRVNTGSYRSTSCSSRPKRSASTSASASWNRETAESVGEPRPRMTMRENRGAFAIRRRRERGVVKETSPETETAEFEFVSASSACRPGDDDAFPSPEVARAFGTNPASSMRRTRAFANGASRISRTARSICDHVLSTEASGGSSAGPESVSARTCSARNAVELIFRLEPFETTVHSSSPMVPPARCGYHARAQPSSFASPGRAVGCAPPHARPRLAH
jgi:hypothetical protein